MLQMNDEDTIDSFTAKLTSIVTRANGLGSTFDKPTLVRKLLNSVPDRFIQIIASIEQHSDLDTMTLDKAIGRLKTFEERIKCKKGILGDSQDKLLFTHHDNNFGHGRHSENCGQGRLNQSRG
ncbi:hypothetical protein HanIR_Chr11g0506831 [Helianthus annuus]|nr:hypothetical protein HanIR_Chr11g0506831 [Helianthus annuus]